MDRDSIPASYVYRGTGAGWKRENPKPKELWVCDCYGVSVWLDVPDGSGLCAEVKQPKVNPPYLKNCPDCWARRPY